MVAIKTIMTINPTTTLRKADAWLARMASTDNRAPIRLPTRVDAATPEEQSQQLPAQVSERSSPIPKGIVFRTRRL